MSPRFLFFAPRWCCCFGPNPGFFLEQHLGGVALNETQIPPLPVPSTSLALHPFFPTSSIPQAISPAPGRCFDPFLEQYLGGVTSNETQMPLSSFHHLSNAAGIHSEE